MPTGTRLMTNELATLPAESLPPATLEGDHQVVTPVTNANSRKELPALVVRAGRPAVQAWTDCFDGKIRNRHTRKVYQRYVRHFLDWCEPQGLELPRIMAGDVGRYLSQLSGGAAKKKGTLSALRKYFRLLVERHIC